MKSNFMFLYFLLITLILFSSIITCAGNNVKKSVEENRDDNGEMNDEAKDESLDIPVEIEPNINNITCTRRQNSQIHEIRTAQYKQFPFMVAVMSHQNEHLCSGTIVTNGLILTTAHCITQPISYILLNATKAKKDDTTVALHITKSEKFPTFASTVSDKDVALIYTEKYNNAIAAKIKLSNFTVARSIIDLEVLGFGLNADVGQTKELQYVGVENRVTPIGLGSVYDVIHGYIDCIDTKVPTCFKDTGGPAIFDNELVGIVVNGDNTCTKELTSSYAVNKKIVDILPTYKFKAWLDEKINKNEVQGHVALVTYPIKPTLRHEQKLYQMLSRSMGCKINIRYLVIGFMILSQVLR